jgi:hypothetical protein
MKKRWLAIGAAVVIGGAYFLVHGHGSANAMSKAQRDSKVALESHPVDVPVVPDPFTPHPAPKFVKPVPVYNPANKSWEMPVTDAVPDPEGVAREEFGYRSHRLKLGLGDEAGRCYEGGPDGKEEIHIAFAMIVEN